MKDTKAFLSKKKKDPEENEEGGKERKSGGTLTGGNSEKDQKKDKLRKGGTLFTFEGAWGYDIEPYSIYQGEEEEEVLLERPERGV